MSERAEVRLDVRVWKGVRREISFTISFPPDRDDLLEKISGFVDEMQREQAIEAKP